MENFTPIASSLGGALLGLASVLVLVSQRRVAGVSGICGALLSPSPGDVSWRVAFTVGLLATGAAAAVLFPAAVASDGVPALPWVALAGVLVGFGTRLGNGCTSGHGVCGISRFSLRSFAATLTFMFTGGLTVWVWKLVSGAGT
jgi:uncharacterized membrane protein YedE/YeeE